MSGKGFMDWIKSLIPNSNDNPDISIPPSDSKSKIKQDEFISKTYCWYFAPIRQQYLWGHDKNGNPGFVVLYGEQVFDENAQTLSDPVTYTHYAIFKGSNRHFPSFDPISVVEEYNYRNRKSDKSMNLKFKVRNRRYYLKNPKFEKPLDSVASFKPLSKNIEMTYFVKVDYDTVLEKVFESNNVFPDFTVAKQFTNVLNLPDSLSGYSQLLFELYCNPKIYSRKKILEQLVLSDSPKELYLYLLNTGSAELISGVFLELAKQNNPILVDDMVDILSRDFSFAHENFRKGIFRSANIYTTLFDSVQKEKDIANIYKNVDDLSLKFTPTYRNSITNKEILSGSDYANLQMMGKLNLYTYEYDMNTRKWKHIKRENMYEANYYCQDNLLKIVNVKDTLQRAEIYGLEDVVAKVGYFADTPSTVYNLKSVSNSGGYKYLTSYVKRIIKKYMTTDEDKFINLQKTLFLLYRPEDYVSYFSDNFTDNILIKDILYKRYPCENLMYTDYRRSPKTRYEIGAEIWDKHLDAALEVAKGTTVSLISETFYKILTDNKNISFIQNVAALSDVISLLNSVHKPMANTALEIVKARLDRETEFDINTLLALIDCENPAAASLATDYLARVGGTLAPAQLARFLGLADLEPWINMIEHQLDKYSPGQFIDFVMALGNDIDNFIAKKTKLSKEIKDILLSSISKILDASDDKKDLLFSSVVDTMQKNPIIPRFLIELLEQSVFVLPIDEIERLSQNLTIDLSNPMEELCYLSLGFIKSIGAKRLPTDSMIVQIMELGGSQMMGTLNEMSLAHLDQIKMRHTTVLLYFESEVASFNEMAKQIFESYTDTEKQDMHMMLIDSPVPHVYKYATEQLSILYPDNKNIPKEFLNRLLEHPSPIVRAFASDKAILFLENLGDGDIELFTYYARSILYLPNKISKSKRNIYKSLPLFAKKYPDSRSNIEKLLLDLGGSGIISDSEQALVALATIRKGENLVESKL